ncbi:unnamed protein product [Citrullus colocynthis]|uniref:Uncharacterized protein n=1 Tax=Citrullus colocynthis TaxID=252529 RepID=A0ABP0Y2D2_9ROSI
MAINFLQWADGDRSVKVLIVEFGSNLSPLRWRLGGTKNWAQRWAIVFNEHKQSSEATSSSLSVLLCLIPFLSIRKRKDQKTDSKKRANCPFHHFYSPSLVPLALLSDSTRQRNRSESKTPLFLSWLQLVS